MDWPGGISAREQKQNPLRTRVQEVPTEDEAQRVFVIDSDERNMMQRVMRLGDRTVTSPVAAFQRAHRYMLFLGPDGPAGPTIFPDNVIEVPR